MPSARDTATLPGALAAQPGSSPSDSAPTTLLRMQGIVKRYGTLRALDGVDLEVRGGEIHALLGENGAGKSTLMQVLAGLTQPDAGTITLAGQRVRIGSPRAARALGIAMVHQHFTLVPAFTVEENLALDAPGRGLTANYSAATEAEAALKRAADLGWQLQPKARVSELPVGAQQRVEIVKALATDARLLIFDEPTAVLAGDEVEELFQVLRRLRDEGCAVILIAHKLAEILAVADHVTVLRRGQRVASCLVNETDAPQLAQWMVGAVQVTDQQAVENREIREIREKVQNEEPTPDAQHPKSEIRNLKSSDGPLLLAASELVVCGDRGEVAVDHLSLRLHAGEIFGIGGVDGNGQTELAEALVGLRTLESGTIRWKEGPFVPGYAPRVGYIPQDRRRSGLAVTMSIEDNLLWDAVREPGFRRGPLLRRRELHRLAESLRRQFDIRIPSVSLPASALSGGNQQKIVVARAFYPQPEWIVAVNPTRGLDIGATRFVHAQLRQARERGAAIALISTDLDEIAALADRAAILSGGHLTEFRADQSDSTQIGLLLGGLGAAPPQQSTPQQSMESKESKEPA